MTVTRTCASCGYTGGYASAPLADAHHPRHSCDKHRQTVERAARRAVRTRTRVSRECTHPEGHHVHGTRAAYVKDRCRCTDCTAANAAAGRTANRERAYGRWRPLLDAAPVRDHLAALRAAGIGVEHIADLADMSVSHIRELADPSRSGSSAPRRVLPRTAERISAININDANRAPHSRVDATGTRRRLQALCAIGWTPELLADHLNRRPNSLKRSMTSQSVTAHTAQDVADLYERLENTPPSRATGEQRAAANAARADATAWGWKPPLAWDNIDTDPSPQLTALTPPADDVDLVAVERAMTGDGVRYGDLTVAEQQEVIHRLSARGRSIRDIAAQLVTTKRTVSRRRASLGP